MQALADANLRVEKATAELAAARQDHDGPQEIAARFTSRRDALVQARDRFATESRAAQQKAMWDLAGIENPRRSRSGSWPSRRLKNREPNALARWG